MQDEVQNLDLSNKISCRVASTTPAKSVLQLRRLQEGVSQSLAYRPVAGPQKLQHRGRTNPNHSGTV